MNKEFDESVGAIGMANLLAKMFRIDIDYDTINLSENGLFGEVLMYSRSTNDIVFKMAILFESVDDMDIPDTFAKEVSKAISEGLINSNELSQLLNGLN